MSNPDSMPIRRLLGREVGEMLNALILTVRCNRCLLEMDAVDWQDHREKECPALYPPEET